MRTPAQRLQHLPPAASRGMVLAVTLLFLFVLTLLGITVMSISQQELKMASQFQQQARIREQAEACLKVAEADATALVDTQLNTATSALSTAPGHIDVAGGAMAAPVADPAFWNDAAQTLPCGSGGRYVIEYLGLRNIVSAADRHTGKTRSLHAFRISARGYDTAGDIQVVLQTLFLRNDI